MQTHTNTVPTDRQRSITSEITDVARRVHTVIDSMEREARADA